MLVLNVQSESSIDEESRLKQKILALEKQLNTAKMRCSLYEQLVGSLTQLPVSKKTKLVSLLHGQYSLTELLSLIHLPRTTYYYRKKQDPSFDKYESLKCFIRKTFLKSDETYGYRRICHLANESGFKCSPNTVLKLMGDLNLHVTVYSKHDDKYNSYEGNNGLQSDNVLQQKFDAIQPYTVLHTDITQVRLRDNRWGYISAVLDEASREVLSVVVTASPDKKQINQMLDQLKDRLPQGSYPIMHSDQGWQYQQADYHWRLKEMGIIQSMSRKGNCHDNAPIENFFSILKRERLDRYPPHTLHELRETVSSYVEWYNHERISLTRDGIPPVLYRNQYV